jgi:thiamine transport system permease protein
VGTAWEQLDQKIENAARVLGATPNNVFWKITLPLLLPSVLSAAILVFLFDFTSFGVILMMGGAAFTTIEVEIYIQTMQFLNLKMAGMLSLIQLIFTMLLTFLSLRFSGDKNVPIIPMIEGEGLRKPDSFLEKSFVFILSMILVVLLVSPTAALLLRSILSITTSNSTGELANWKLTLENYRGLFFNERHSLFFVPPITALRNSVLYAVVSMTTALIIGTMISVSSSKDEQSNKGLGYLSTFSSVPNSIRWFPVLIPMTHALIALPFVIRIIQPVIDSIPKNLHEAAMTLGVPEKQLWKHVDLPLIKKSLVTAAIYAFAISLGEFGATSFLTRPEYPTLPIAIFRYLNLPGGENYGKAMAMAAILLVICGGGFFMIDHLQIKMKGKKQ